MTLDQAIEIIENFLRGDEPDEPSDLPTAFRLSIEALKRVGETRKDMYRWDLTPLPGENE